MSSIDVVAVNELATWDAFPIQLVTAVTQLSSHCRCQNIVTEVSRMAPVFAFGTASGEIVIMQVAPCRVTDVQPSAADLLNNLGGGIGGSLSGDSLSASNDSISTFATSAAAGGAGSFTSFRNSTTSNQRTRTKAQKDTAKAQARADRIGFFQMPQPALPSTAFFSASSPAGVGDSSPAFSSSSSSTGGGLGTISPHQPLTTFANFNLQERPSVMSSSAGTWSIQQMTYSPFSNTIFVLYGGTIYVLHLVPDDENSFDGAASSSSGEEARYLQCVIVGQVAAPQKSHQAQQEREYQYNSSSNHNHHHNPGESPQATQSHFSPGSPSGGFKTSADMHNQSTKTQQAAAKQREKEGWQNFLIHSSPTEVKLVAFAQSEIACFVVDTKKLTLQTAMKEASRSNLFNAAAAASSSNNNNNNNKNQQPPPSHVRSASSTSSENISIEERTFSARGIPGSSSSARGGLVASGSSSSSGSMMSNNSASATAAATPLGSLPSSSATSLFQDHHVSEHGFSTTMRVEINPVNSISRSSKDPVLCSGWCGPLFVVNAGRTHYNFYAPEFTAPICSISATRTTRSKSGVASIFREKSNVHALRVCSLFDSFQMNNNDFSEESPGVALLVSEVVGDSSSSSSGGGGDGGVAAADVALPFSAHIYLFQHGEKAPVFQREIKCLFSASSSVHLASTGPWLIVASNDGGGVDVHSWITGHRVQSAAEEFSDFSIAPTMSSLLTRSASVVQTRGKPIQWHNSATKKHVQGLLARLYVERSVEIIIGGCGRILTLSFESPRSALTSLVKKQVVEDTEEEVTREELMMSLQDFAVTIGNRQNLFGDNTTVGEVLQFEGPDGYDELLQSFKHIRADSQATAAALSPVKEVPKNCLQCKASFGFLTKRHFVCVACLRHFCEKCCPLRSGEELIRRGVMQSGVRICYACLERLDENMYILLSNGKFREALHYLLSSRTLEGRQKHPELYGELANASFGGQSLHLDDLREFHLPHISVQYVDEILWRCIHKGKLALCAQLLPLACGTDEQRWQHFVMWFLTDAEACMSLARNIPHHQLQAQIGKFVYSTILIALVKYSPLLLTQTLGRWPPGLYSAALVSSAIESALKSRLDVAVSIQKECQQGCAPILWDSPWNWKSLGQIYLDEEVKTLVSAHLMLCKKKKMYIDALRVHLQFFEKFLPHLTLQVATTGSMAISATPGMGSSAAAAAVASAKMTAAESAEKAGVHVSRERGGTVVGLNEESGSPLMMHGGGGGGGGDGLSARSSNSSGGGNFTSRSLASPSGNNNNMLSARNRTATLSPVVVANNGGGGARFGSPPTTARRATITNRSSNNNNNNQNYISPSRLFMLKKSKQSALINSFEWILQHNLTDVLLRPGERIGGTISNPSAASAAASGGGVGTTTTTTANVNYEGPSLLPQLVQVWRMDSVKYLLKYPEITTRPDVIDSFVQQIMQIFGINKDGTLASSSSLSSSNQNNLGSSSPGFDPSSNNNKRYLASSSTTTSSQMMRRQQQQQQQQQQYQQYNRGREDQAPVPAVGLENDGAMILQSLLHEITARDVGATTKHHNLLACLYVHHAPHRLLGFLREPLVTTLDYAKLSTLVRQKRMFGELAYIMGRSGDANEAIRLVVRCLRDVKFAIRFVEDTDPQLWDELCRHVLQSPLLIGSFLDHAIGHYDMAKFLEKIPEPNRLKVPRVSQRLGNVMTEKTIDYSLNLTSLNSHREENFQLFKDHYTRAKGAVCFKSAAISCNACGIALGADGTQIAAATGAAGGGDSKQQQQTAALVGKGEYAALHSAVFSVSGRILHPACAEPECGGRIPTVSVDAKKLVQRQARRKMAWKMARDQAHQLASIEVFRDSEMYDICEILPRPLRYEILSYLDYDSIDSAKEVSRSWYLHVRALQCGMDKPALSVFDNVEVQSVFQRFMLHFGTFPSRASPFQIDMAFDGEPEDMFSSSAGLSVGGPDALLSRLNPLRKTEDLLVPVGADVFESRTS